MNQYIITEVELEQLLAIGIDVGYNDSLLVLESNIRSRPYNPQEREKVLKICTREKKRLKFNSGIMSDDCFNEGILWAINKIEEELRKGGEP